MTTTVKVKLRLSAIENRPGTIVYILARHGKSQQISTQFKLFQSEWNAKLAKVVPYASGERQEEIAELQQCIDRDIERLKVLIDIRERRHCNYDVEDIVADFHHEVSTHDLFVFMENIIKGMRSQKQYGTAKNYQSALNKFRLWRKGEDIKFAQIDRLLMDDYQFFLKTSGSKPNTIAFYVRVLRAVYNRAVHQELTKDCKPFQDVFTSMAKTKKRAIPIGDIRRIRNLDLHLFPKLDFARDIFIFLFLCRGMSFVDAAFLKKTDVCHDMITYQRQKTGQQLNIRIVKEIKEIIDKYTDKDSPYLLPIIKPSKGSERKQYETVLRQTNNHLKTIGGMVNLTMTLSTMTARHSWATIAKNKNVPINVISDALGHNSIKTTQIYLGSIDSNTIDKANKLIISDL